MIILHSDDVDKVDSYIDQGNCVFILIYMEGCGPCMSTKPEWLKIEEFSGENNSSAVVADINKDYLSSLKYIGSVDGFPTMKYICKKNGNLVVENYENAKIPKKDRSVQSFVKWIQSKTSDPRNLIVGGSLTVGGSSPYHLLKRLSKKTRKNKKGKKSRKSKKSKKNKKRKSRHYKK